MHVQCNNTPTVLIYWLAVYCPLISGDIVHIREQTLGGDYFVVFNQRSGKTGRVPVDYIDISELAYTCHWIVTEKMVPAQSRSPGPFS